jgi:4-diphosphocytidyl-2-C-methyl-D-erythritol kinase
MRGLAYAKINLTLEVTGKRPDGYHQLVSLMQTVSLADSLSLAPATDSRLECDNPQLGGEDNLVLRAARLLGRGGHFSLRKRIPVAAGLGGGSSDGALALRLLDATYSLGLTDAEMLAAALDLGSDVPFFLHGGTALVEGRGERVTPLPDLARESLVLLNPGVPLSTAAVFRGLKPEEYAATSTSRSSHPYPSLVNTLLAPALRLEPRIADSQERLQAAGLTRVLLSGSGPTVFGLAADDAEARRIARESGGFAVRFVGRAEALKLVRF